MSAYKRAALFINNFSERISKSDRPAFHRLARGLEEGLQSFRPDAQGLPTVALTHPSVAEGARQIHVRITVLNELIAQYDDIPTLQPGIRAMRDLDNSIVSAFGFEQGLVGPGSKALGSLAFLIESEARELYGFLAATNDVVPSAETFKKLIRAAIKVRGAVSARSGGDMAADVELFALKQVWNSPEWQNLLKQFLNAGPDMVSQIQPRLKILLMTSESLNDLKHFSPEESFWMPMDQAANTPRGGANNPVVRKN